jgi:hypothetical protein
VSFRDGSPTDLEATFVLSERAIFDTAVRHGLISRDRAPSEADVHRSWHRQRSLIEFMAAQPGGRYRAAVRSPGLYRIRHAGMAGPAVRVG